MARKAVSESSLNVVSMTIENPEPNSVQLSFTQTFETDSKYYPTLYPFNGSFYLIDKPDNPAFASIRTPKVVAQNGTESQVPAQTVNITFPDEFTRYVLLAFESENFTIALRGNGDLKQGSLPKTTVSYDQNITMKGRPMQPFCNRCANAVQASIDCQASSCCLSTPRILLPVTAQIRTALHQS